VLDTDVGGGLGPARARGLDTGSGGNLNSDCFHVALSRYYGLGCEVFCTVDIGGRELDGA